MGLSWVSLFVEKSRYSSFGRCFSERKRSVLFGSLPWSMPVTRFIFLDSSLRRFGKFLKIYQLRTVRPANGLYEISRIYRLGRLDSNRLVKLLILFLFRYNSSSSSNFSFGIRSIPLNDSFKTASPAKPG